MTDFQVLTVDSLSSINTNFWDSVIEKHDPFISKAFLFGLEEFDCLNHQHWESHHFVVQKDAEIIALLPSYIKTDSYGEFVFDWAWADAYTRYGKQYYPKLITAIPFSPVSGPRLLLHENYASKRSKIITILQEFIIQHCEDEGFSSYHLLFPEPDTQAEWKSEQFRTRIGCQYHWFNRGYESFDDFLAQLNSRKRKKIRHERKQVKEFRVECLNGKETSEQDWISFHRFYCDTFYKKWGEPRLTLPFFLHLAETLGEHCLLFKASYEGALLAGAFALRSENVLYGRHWGCAQDVQFLHFELCYYQTIEYCIQEGIEKLDAGAQGEHKIKRGFEPIKTYSLHWIKDESFRVAIEDYLRQETVHINRYIESLQQHSAYKHA